MSVGPGAGSPVTAVDHLRIRVMELDVAVADYAALLGAEPLWRGALGDGGCAVFFTGNVWLCLVESRAENPAPMGLERLCFRVDDARRMRRRLSRTGLAGEAADEPDPLAVLQPSAAPAPVHVIAAQAARDLSLAFVERPVMPSTGAAPAVLGLDHVVITSGDATATGYLLGGQLGLDLRMDTRRPEWGARLLFFRCGGLVVEVMQSLQDGAARGGDSFFGLSWRVEDAQTAHERLRDSGFEVSGLRGGRKPGTTVFTVRNRTAGVPTLFLQPA